MKKDHQDINRIIKGEADEILYKRGLLRVLQSFGTPYIHGSYLLDLMTWRDLDIYLQVDNLSEADFFVLGGQICSAFAPVKMSFRNEHKARTEGLPHGLYWGIYFGNERAGAWKIDVWAVEARECQKLLAYSNNIRQKLDAEKAQRIVEIKSACWRDPEYRRSYTSADIYKAVLEKNVTNLEEFEGYRRGLQKTD